MGARLVVSDKEREAVQKLDATKRYTYFVKRVVDWETVWGLWQDGWALVADDNGRTGFPLWPAKEYAEAFAEGEWATYRPEEVTLKQLIEDLLGRLREDGLLVGVFPTTSNTGILMSPEELKKALLTECQKYE